jgi:molybdenum cofactor cytidylyltransferase
VTGDHNPQAVARALAESDADVALVLGASATSDRRDVIPAGLVAAGGEVVRFGMPVDPGNLLVLGRKHGQTVIGLPGCARAPALNGADWVMERIAAELPITNEDFADMGLGGLLKEIPDRIQPRALHVVSKRCMAAVLPAAGASRRMGGENKRLRHIDGVPLLRRPAETLLASGIDHCVVVIAAGATDHRRALEGLPVTITEAVDAALGMSASLCAGVAALPDEAVAVLVALADMPDLTPEDIIRVIEGHSPDKGQLIVCPLDDMGRRGHPVLFDRRYFEILQNLSGDNGAREVLRAVPDAILEVQVGAAVSRDLDTPQDWADWDRQARSVTRVVRLKGHCQTKITSGGQGRRTASRNDKTQPLPLLQDVA